MRKALPARRSPTGQDKPARLKAQAILIIVNLQIVDYVSWALYRKWNTGDTRSYEVIRECVKAEGDLFRDGDAEYY